MCRRFCQLFVALAFALNVCECVSAEPNVLPAPSTKPRLRTERLPAVDERRADHVRLEDLEQLALTNNPSLARFAAAMRAAQGGWTQAGLYPNPTLGIGEQQAGSRGIEEQDGVTLQQEFVTGRKLKLNREVASREVAWQRQQWEVQRFRVLTDVRSEFFNVAIGERQRKVTKELVDVAELGLAAAEERNTGDEIGRNDVLEAKIELYNAQIGQNQGENRALMARQRLAAAVGLPQIVSIKLDVDLDQLAPRKTFDETLASIRDRSPEIAAAYAEIERNQWALKRAGVEKIPNITATGLYNWRDNGVLGGKPDGGFQFSLPVPIFDRNQGGVQRALGDLQFAERTLQQLELSLRDRLADAFETYANARMQVAKYRDEILPAAAEALQLTRAAYLAGKVEWDDLFTSQRTNANANMEYLKSLKDLRVSEMEIEGLLLSGSLDNTARAAGDP